MQASIFDPEPKSLKIPAAIAALTRESASSLYKHAFKFNKQTTKQKCNALTSMSGFQFVSNTAMAARLPDPIVTYGSLSVEPWGWIVNKCGPVASTPPNTSAAPICP